MDLNKNTVLCKYFQTNSCHNYKCKYAHSVEELLPRMCCYGNNCNFDRRNRKFNKKRRACCYFHPGEIITKYELYKRAIEYNDIHKDNYSCDFDKVVMSVFKFLEL
jgi:hypothetical protein